MSSAPTYDRATVVRSARESGRPTEYLVSLATNGQVPMGDLAGLIDECRPASQSGPAPSLSCSPGGAVSLRGVPGVSVKFGLQVFPATLAWLFEHRESVEKFVKANRENLSFCKADSEKFAARKAAAQAAYAKRTAK